MGAGGPANFYFGCFRVAEAEVEALIAGGNVAAGGGGEARLAVDLDASAQAIAIAARAAQGDREPVSSGWVTVEYERLSA